MAAQFPISLKLNAVEKASAALNKVSQSLGKMGQATTRAANKFQLLRAKTAGFATAMKKAGKAIKSVGKSMSQNVTLPVVGAGVAIIRTAANFEKSMNKVKALTGESGEKFNEMRELAKKLGAETQFSASEAADAMSFLGMAGFNANEILQATPGLLNLAAASSTDLAQTADIASNIMGAFGLAASETTRVADILANTTASSNVTLEMLSETMKQAAPNAADFGATLEETAAAAGLLGNIGIQGSAAGTALKRAFASLASPVGEAGQVLKALGINVADSKGNMLKFGDIMKSLAANLGKFPQQTRIQALQAIFGNIGKTGASALAKFADSGELAKFTASLVSSTDKAETMAKIMNEGAAGSMKAMMSAAEGLAIAIGDSGLLQIFTDIVVKVTAWIRKFTETNPMLFKMGALIAVVAAAAGPLIVILGMIVTSMSALAPIMAVVGTVLGLVTLKFVLIAAAIAGAITLSYLFVKNWDKIKDWVIGIADSIGNAFKNMWDGITNMFKNGFNWLQNKMSNLPGPLKTLLKFSPMGLIGNAIGLFDGKKDTAESRREERGAPSAFGSLRSVSSSALSGVRNSTIEKRSKVQIEIKDPGGNSRVRADLGDNDINIHAGMQGAGA